MTCVGDFVIRDKLVLLIDTHLDVVATSVLSISADRHHAAVGIGERNLGLAAFIEIRSPVPWLLPQALHLVDFLLQFLRRELLLLRFFFVGFIHLVQIAIDVRRASGWLAGASSCRHS